MKPAPSSKTHALVAGALSAAMVASGALVGCSADSTTKVGTEYGTCDRSMVATFTETEVRSALALVGKGDVADTVVSVLDSGTVEDITADKSGSESVYTLSLSSSDILPTSKVSESRAVYYTNDAQFDYTLAAISLDFALEDAGLDDVSVSDVITALSEMEVTLNVSCAFDKDIVATSWPQIDSKTVGFTATAKLGDLAAPAGTAFTGVELGGYAVFDEAALSATDAKGDSGQGWTNEYCVEYKSSGVIESVVVDGEKTEGVNYAAWYKQGTHNVTVNLLGGASKSFTYRYDCKKPKANVKNGGVYKIGKKLSISDSASGVKSATLDGKRVKSGAKVTKKGTHRLVVTDKAGNKLSVKFRVR